MLRRVAGIGLAWGVLWIAVAAVAGTIIGIVDPDSIDPGEPIAAVIIFGPMGFLSGVVFALLLGGSRSAASDVSLARSASIGFMATAVVQVAYLGHGDAGLAANLMMALLFSAVGAVVAAMWLILARQKRIPSHR